MALVMSPENRMPPSAMSGTPVFFRDLPAVHDGRDLGYTHAGNDAVVQMVTRTDADLDAVHPCGDEILRTLAGADIAGDQLNVRERALEELDGIDDIFAVAVDVSMRRTSASASRSAAARSSMSGPTPTGRADAKPPLSRPCRHIGYFFDLLDVLDGDHALQPAVSVDHQQLLDAVFVKGFLALLEGDALGYRDKIFAGHHLGDFFAEIGFESEIPIGENAYELVVPGDREPRDPVAFHDFSEHRRSPGPDEWSPDR